MVEGSGVQSEEDWGIGCVGEILEKGMKSDFGRRHEAQSDCRNQWMYCIISHGSIFKCCQCIITITAPVTLAVATFAVLTPDYEVLTNQGDALVSVYINSVIL